MLQMVYQKPIELFQNMVMRNINDAKVVTPLW